MKRYSEMSREELLAEMDKLAAEKSRAEFPSQAELLERKYWMAKAYTLSPNSFPPGIYEVEGNEFMLEYINGIMAWGKMGLNNEASFPISMLKKVERL